MAMNSFWPADRDWSRAAASPPRSGLHSDLRRQMAQLN